MDIIHRPAVSYTSPLPLFEIRRGILHFSASKNSFCEEIASESCASSDSAAVVICRAEEKMALSLRAETGGEARRESEATMVIGTKCSVGP